MTDRHCYKMIKTPATDIFMSEQSRSRPNLYNYFDIHKDFLARSKIIHPRTHHPFSVYISGVLKDCGHILGQFCCITIKRSQPRRRFRGHLLITGVNQKVLPVLSNETLLHIWLSTEYYGFRPSSTADDTVSLHALDPTVPRKTNANRIFISADSQRGIEHCF